MILNLLGSLLNLLLHDGALCPLLIFTRNADLWLIGL